MRILHVATHAVVDVESPERSALVLAQGAASAPREARREAWEDGEPAAMWAGLGGMGDAALVPVRPAARGLERSVLVGVCAGTGLLALGSWGLGMRRKRGSGQA